VRNVRELKKEFNNEWRTKQYSMETFEKYTTTDIKWTGENRRKFEG
jgi:hypothetical protein